VTLAANTTYYLVSQETSGGDFWYDFGGVTASTAVSIPSAEYKDGGIWGDYGSPNQSYGPVSLLYTMGAPLFSAFTPGTPRNDFAGWVGTQINIGSTPMTVTALGRLYVAGNTGSHTVQMVDAVSKAVVTAAMVRPSIGAAGQFTYVGLSTPVTLPANSNYFLVSQETSGGDRWYDYGPVTAASAVTIPNALYGSGGSWGTYGTTNQSYVPVNLLYTLTVNAVPVTIASNPPGISVAVDGLAYITPRMVSWTAGSVHTIAVHDSRSCDRLGKQFNNEEPGVDCDGCSDEGVYPARSARDRDRATVVWAPQHTRGNRVVKK
jgi:hypothetical protein